MKKGLFFLFVALFVAGSTAAAEINVFYVDMDMLLEQFPGVKTADENLEMYRREQEEALYKEIDVIRKPLNVEPLKSKSEKYVDTFKKVNTLLAKRASGLLTPDEEKQLDKLAKEMEALEKDLGPITIQVNDAIGKFNEKVATHRVELVTQNRARIKSAIDEFVTKDLKKRNVVIEGIDSRHIYIDPALNITQKIIDKLK